MDSIIAGFRGKYRWLSNFERCDIYYKGILYRSTEAAYQAQKTMDIQCRQIFSKLDSRESKRLGKNIVIRGDWDDVKLDIMYGVCFEKFKLPKFRQLLLATGSAHIEESNHYHDRYWGTTDGEGENHLGKILMRIRSEIQKDIKA